MITEGAIIGVTGSLAGAGLGLAAAAWFAGHFLFVTGQKKPRPGAGAKYREDSDEIQFSKKIVPITACDRRRQRRVERPAISAEPRPCYASLPLNARRNVDGHFSSVNGHTLWAVHVRARDGGDGRQCPSPSFSKNHHNSSVQASAKA